MNLSSFWGIGASPGIVVAPVYIIRGREYDIPTHRIEQDAIPTELKRFDQALAKAKKQINSIQKVVARKLSKNEADIFSAHLYVLEDPLLENETKQLIQSELTNAAHALEIVTEKLFNQFNEIDDTYIQERAIDLVDVSRRVLSFLIPNEHEKISLKEPSIVVAPELSPSETVNFKRNKIMGIVTEKGGTTSHVAILSRSLKIPSIVGAEHILGYLQDGDILAMDAITGELVINPAQEEVETFQKKKKELLAFEQKMAEEKSLPAKTKQGSIVSIKMNLELEEEIKEIDNDSHDGVGLCRTEFLYLNRENLPDEDEQYKIYKEILDKSNNKPVTFRTLDIGGDKIANNLDFSWEKERNPFLGLRGLRLSLRFPRIFLKQLRALLRASVHGPAKIMFPMVSGLSEFIQAKSFLDQAKEELVYEGIPYQDEIEVGIMIEVPSAALTVDILARHVDFLSVGTNDLVQYITAADRMNPEVSNVYNPYHPAVIKVLREIVQQAHRFDCPVSVCGELAGDDRYFPLFVALGIRELSMSTYFISRVKNIIRSLDENNCNNMISEILSMETAEQVEAVLRKRYHAKWQQCS